MSQNGDEKVSWKEISPQYAHDYFGAWAFTIKDGHRPALGIQSREFMDKEKTEELRVQWENVRTSCVTVCSIRGKVSQWTRKGHWLSSNGEKFCRLAENRSTPSRSTYKPRPLRKR